jgi:transcriptional regulator with GAF, ATPase, and Fis domain
MEISELKQHGDILGQSAAIRKVLRQIAQVAPTTSTVLVTGETGTGKELVARAIHNASPRRDHALVAVNSSALPEGLIESELFGREKGAYTGALTRQPGRFEVANRSTLFLDEIGDLPLNLQARLLRVLEGGRFERLGGTKTIEVDVRVIAATNRNLEEEVASGRFRRDLFYRINVFRIPIPPLRERPEDIPLLVRAFVAEFAARMGKTIDAIPANAVEELLTYPWPGNVRELRNVIEHAMIVSRGRKLEFQSQVSTLKPAPRLRSLEEVERDHIQSVLQRTGWRVKGAGGAAEILALKPTTLFSKMKKLHIPARHQKYDISP